MPPVTFSTLPRPASARACRSRRGWRRRPVRVRRCAMADARPPAVSGRGIGQVLRQHAEHVRVHRHAIVGDNASRGKTPRLLQRNTATTQPTHGSQPPQSSPGSQSPSKTTATVACKRLRHNQHPCVVGGSSLPRSGCPRAARIGRDDGPIPRPASSGSSHGYPFRTPLGCAPSPNEAIAFSAASPWTNPKTGADLVAVWQDQVATRAASARRTSSPRASGARGVAA